MKPKTTTAHASEKGAPIRDVTLPLYPCLHCFLTNALNLWTREITAHEKKMPVLHESVSCLSEVIGDLVGSNAQDQHINGYLAQMGDEIAGFVLEAQARKKTQKRQAN